MNLASEQLKYNFKHNKGFFDQKAVINEKINLKAIREFITLL